MTELRQYEKFFHECEAVVAIIRRSGRCETREFLEKIPRQHQARFEYLLQKLCSNQPMKVPERRRTIRKRGKDGMLVQELKTGKYRFYLVEYEGYWCATHGRKKPADSRVPIEAEKAVNSYKRWRAGEE